jgi:hypothetical protein
MAVRVRRAFLTSACNNTAPARLQLRKMATAPGQSAFTAPLKSKSNSGTAVPRFIYGTAWKKAQTANLVYQALKAGFLAIDTAAQPRHYNEALVGEGIGRAIHEQIVKREDLYVRSPSPLFEYDVNFLDPNQIHPSLRPRPPRHALQCLSAFGRTNTHLDCLLALPLYFSRFRRAIRRLSSPTFTSPYTPRNSTRLESIWVLRPS